MCTDLTRIDESGVDTPLVGRYFLWISTDSMTSPCWMTRTTSIPLVTLPKTAWQDVPRTSHGRCSERGHRAVHVLNKETSVAVSGEKSIELRRSKKNWSGFRGSSGTPSSRTALLVAFAFMLVRIYDAHFDAIAVVARFPPFVRTVQENFRNKRRGRSNGGGAS